MATPLAVELSLINLSIGPAQSPRIRSGQDVHQPEEFVEFPGTRRKFTLSEFRFIFNYRDGLTGRVVPLPASRAGVQRSPDVLLSPRLYSKSISVPQP